MPGLIGVNRRAFSKLALRFAAGATLGDMIFLRRDRAMAASTGEFEGASPVPNDGGYNSKDLPPDAVYPTVEAHYYRGEGGWGPAPALQLRCRTCGHVYGQQSSSYSKPRIPDLEDAMRWMRKQCPRGQANCKV